MRKLETGKDIQEEELYRFFLLKLGKKYAYSPTKENDYLACFSSLNACITSGNLAAMLKINLPVISPTNLLYDFYDRLLMTLYRFYTLAEFPPIDRMNEISELWFCVPTLLRPLATVFFVLAKSAHPFYDRINLDSILDHYPVHPLELLSFALIAAEKERFTVAQLLRKRYGEIECEGEFARFLVHQIDIYTSVLRQNARHPLRIVIANDLHPLFQLVLRSLAFHLGRHAIDTHAFQKALVYFSVLEECSEPYGVFAAWIVKKPYRGPDLQNPKLQSMVVYLKSNLSLLPDERLAMLMKQVLAHMDQHDAFLSIFVRYEILALVGLTHRYKTAYDYLRMTQIIDKR